MQPDYSDLTSRLGAPLWWDGRGVPRYEPFGPKLCGTYVREVALLHVGCQACDQTFIVAIELERKDLPSMRPVINPDEARDAWDAANSFAYGDPPRHGCPSGDSMTSVPLRIVEFWVNEGPDWNWVRLCRYEGRLPAEDLA